MRCAQLIYRCAQASRSAVQRVSRQTALFAPRTARNTARYTVNHLVTARTRWIETRPFSSEAVVTDVHTGASQGQKKNKPQRSNNNYNSNDNEIVNIFKVNDETELDNYQLESKTIGQLIAIMTTLWVKFSNGAKALNIWNNAIYPRTGLNNMSIEEALEIVPVLADLKQYDHAIDIYEQVLRPALLAQRLRVSQLNSTGPHTYKRGNYSRPAALPSLFHAFFTRVAMSEFPTPQQLGDATATDHTRTADEVQRDAERLLELWNWVWEEDQATKPTARYLSRDTSSRESDKEITEMPSKQLLNVTRVKEQTTITLSAHKAAKLLSNARALEQIMDYIPQRNWRIVRNTYEILIKEAVTQGKDGALKALEQFQTLCRFGVNSPALCKTVVMALREHNRHHEIVHLAHQIAQGELDLGKMVPDRATLNAVIHACLEIHQSRAAIDVWNWFVRQYEQRSDARAVQAVQAVLGSDATEGNESAEVTVNDRDKDKEVLLKPYFSTIDKYLMLISASNSPVSEAEKLLKTLKTHFAPIAASTYAGMLRIAAKANNIEFAIALWTDMKQQAKHQVSSAESSAASENDQSYNDAVVYASMAQTLLLLLGRQLTSEAWHTRAEMILSELTQLFNTNITHNFVNAFIDQTLRRNYHPETVLDMVSSFIKITGKYPTDVPILQELFDQAAKLGRAELALALFATLKDAQTSSGEEGEQSDMYSTLLIAYARSGELDKLTRVWALMKQQNIIPNEAGFTAVLDGYKDKDTEKAADLIIQAKAVPTAIYAATLEVLLNENKVDKAAEVFAALYTREPSKLQRVNKNVLRRLSTALTKDKTVAMRNSVMPHLRAAINF